jgi:hypothetical protein
MSAFGRKRKFVGAGVTQQEARANKKGCTSIDCWCSLFLLHAASNQAAPHGLAATALDPIRAGDY